MWVESNMLDAISLFEMSCALDALVIHQYMDGSKTLWVNSEGNNMVRNIKIDGLDSTQLIMGYHNIN